VIGAGNIVINSTQGGLTLDLTKKFSNPNANFNILTPIINIPILNYSNNVQSV